MEAGPGGTKFNFFYEIQAARPRFLYDFENFVIPTAGRDLMPTK